MEFGVEIFLTDQTIQPAELAVALEDRGFHTLWLPEHTNVPISLKLLPTAGPIPDAFKRMYDPFVALTHAAAATKTLRVGTGICLVAQRDPIILAKSVATIDHLSDGRFSFGVGYGWNRDEALQHGVNWPTRRAVVRERCLAMRRIWTEDVAEFQGEYLQIEPTEIWPKPIQQPYPPIIVGAKAGPTTFDHIIEFADGWMPQDGYGSGPLDSTIEELKRRAEKAGRDPTDIDVITMSSPPDPRHLEWLESLGVRGVIFQLPPAGRDEVLPLLDDIARDCMAHF